jgi:protein-disulfide isomerase
MSLTPPVNKNDHIQGEAAARIELVEYGDFQCSFCGEAYHIVKSIQNRFGSDLKFVFRHFPLTEIHHHAKMAAVAAEAAGRQGKFWQMHDMLYENQDELHLSALRAYAAILEMDVLKFDEDMDDEALFQKVQDDFESGLRSGVHGTPTFYVNGEKYSLNWDESSLMSFISNKLEHLPVA